MEINSSIRGNHVKNAASVKSGEDISLGAEVWVKKWVDYSTKYGLGYLLSNNTMGVFYNDSTKLIMG